MRQLGILLVCAVSLWAMSACAQNRAGSDVAGGQDPAAPGDVARMAEVPTATTQPAADTEPALPKGHPDIAALLAAQAAGATTNPTTQPVALPKGHPDIAAMLAAQAAAAGATTNPSQGPPALPKGHPDIAQLIAAREAAARAAAATQPAATQPMTLPKGHPDIAAMMAARATTAPTTREGEADPRTNLQPPAGTALPPGHPDISGRKPVVPPGGRGGGTIVVHASQGTAQGPSLAGDVVKLELVYENQLLGQMDGQLDKEGVYTFKDIPIGIPVQPLVTVTHAGVPYQAIGSTIDADHAVQDFGLTVYESTDTRPDWVVRMRHLLVSAVPDGLQVTEMIAVDCPGDRAWTGVAGKDGKRATLVLDLPAGAEHIDPVGGFQEGLTSIADGRLSSFAQLLPGTTQFQLSYTLPVKDGKAQITTKAPAAVKIMMVFLPDDGSIVTSEGLQLTGTSNGEDQRKRFYRATDLQPGQVASLSVTGVKLPAKKSDAPSSIRNASQTAQVIAIVGGVLILLVGAAVFLIRAPRAAAAKTAGSRPEAKNTRDIPPRRRKA